VPSGARHPSITPFETFHASDGLFVIAAGNDALFVKLCHVLQLPLAYDPRFKTNPDRCENARLLKRLIEAVTIEFPKAHWIDKLENAGIPNGPIQSVDQVMADPQILARNMIVEILNTDGFPTYKGAGNPIKISDMPDSTIRPAAPRLDGNRQEILAWLSED